MSSEHLTGITFTFTFHLYCVVIYHHHHHSWWWHFQQLIRWRLWTWRYLRLTEYSNFKYLLSMLCSICNCVSVTGVNSVHSLMCTLPSCAQREKLDCTCLNKELASYHICGTKVMVVLDSCRSSIPSSRQKQVLSFPLVGSCSETQLTSRMSVFFFTGQASVHI